MKPGKPKWLPCLGVLAARSLLCLPWLGCSPARLLALEAEAGFAGLCWSVGLPAGRLVACLPACRSACLPVGVCVAAKGPQEFQRRANA